MIKLRRQRLQCNMFTTTKEISVKPHRPISEVDGVVVQFRSGGRQRKTFQELKAETNEMRVTEVSSLTE